MIEQDVKETVGKKYKHRRLRMACSTGGLIVGMVVFGSYVPVPRSVDPVKDAVSRVIGISHADQFLCGDAWVSMGTICFVSETPAWKSQDRVEQEGPSTLHIVKVKKEPITVATLADIVLGPEPVAVKPEPKPPLSWKSLNYCIVDVKSGGVVYIDEWVFYCMKEKNYKFASTCKKMLDVYRAECWDK